MAAFSRRLLHNTPVASAAEMFEVLAKRCQEKNIATSSLNKLDGVSTPWLHEVLAGRQKSTDVHQLFDLLNALGLKVTVEVVRQTGQTGIKAAKAAKAAKKAVVRPAGELVDPADVPQVEWTDQPQVTQSLTEEEWAAWKSQAERNDMPASIISAGAKQDIAKMLKDGVDVIV